MKQVRILSQVLRYVALVIGVAISLTVLYALMLIAGYEALNLSGIPLHVEGDKFTVHYPFTTVPFLIGDYNVSFIVSYFATMVFYAMFLFMLACVFRSFMQKKLFSNKNVQVLSSFYLVNFCFPFFLLVLVMFFNTALDDALRISSLHLVIGVFAFFMAAIFKQGLILQEEQDLTF